MSTTAGVAPGPDGRLRCAWSVASADYAAYHDGEWGQPVRGDDALFERISLEAFQSGLAWITILRKREAFRAAFSGFSIERVAAFTARDEARCLADAGIVRNRAKISATVANARAVAALLDQEGPGAFDTLVWSHALPSRARPATPADVPAVTPESTALARSLKTAGLRFVGPTTAYATMQAVGLVNDHLQACQVPVGSIPSHRG
jgi:DNA-3-methyladenine glycosylase I